MMEPVSHEADENNDGDQQKGPFLSNKFSIRNPSQYNSWNSSLVLKQDLVVENLALLHYTQ